MSDSNLIKPKLKTITYDAIGVIIDYRNGTLTLSILEGTLTLSILETGESIDSKQASQSSFPARSTES
jgi:hypothetical protein